MSRTRWLSLLGVIAFVLVSGLGSLGLVDYDEAVYAQVSHEMATRGDGLHPTLQGEGWYEKPPFIYWTQMAGYAALGKSVWAVRVLNALAALLGASFLVWTLGPLFGSVRVRWASIMFLTCAFVLGLSQITLTDMWLTTWLVLALGSTCRAIRPWERTGRVHRGWWASASCACGLAMLTKGAIGLVLPAGALFFYLVATRQLRFVRHMGLIAWGMLLSLAIGFSWYLLLGLTADGGFTFMGELFMEHHVGRFVRPMQGHRGPFFFYGPILAIGLIPWLPYALSGMGRAPRARLDQDAKQALRLFGSFAAVTFLFFSAAATKLPNYVAPVFPALCLFAAALLDDEHERATTNRPLRGWLYVAHVVALLVVASLAFAHRPLLERAQAQPHRKALAELPGLAEPFDAGVGPYLLGGVALLAAALVFWQWRTRRPQGVATVLALAATAMLAVCTHVLLPRFDRHFQAPLRDVARNAAAVTEREERVLLLGVRHRPSVLFYGSRDTTYVSIKHPQKLLDTLTDAWPRIGIVRTHEIDTLERVVQTEVLGSRGGWSLVRVAPPDESK